MPRRPRNTHAGNAPSSQSRDALPAGKPEPKNVSQQALDALRARIDSIDHRLVRLLNERSKVVVKVGHAKRHSGIPIYAPHREAQVLAKVLGLNAGPLPGRTIEAIYRELMSGSFTLERALRIGYLGPSGSFSHEAGVRHFGRSVDFENLHEIEGVFTEIARGHVDYGLVPIENSTHGGITETLDGLARHAGRVYVYAEVQLAVHHALMADCEPRKVTRIMSKPEVFTQCRKWLATQYPQATLVPVASTSRAVQMVAEESAAMAKGATPSDGCAAAIGSALAGDLYGVSVLFPRIEDHPNNVTRFFVIAGHKAHRSGDDKTAIMFSASDTPGALASVLAVFHRQGINLTHIDKRPAGRKNWEYTFFVDAQGHIDDPGMARAVRLAAKYCRDLQVLGSFPRSKRVL